VLRIATVQRDPMKAFIDDFALPLATAVIRPTFPEAAA
jgi:hypothetical protein